MTEPLTDEITLRKLEILLAFMNAETVAGAAEQLGISPVSAHRALRSLEAGVRCPLFVPDGRNIRPTEAARVLASAAQAALGLLYEGIAASRTVGGYAAGCLRIGSLYSLSVQAIPRILRSLQERRPDLDTKIAMGSNAKLLAQLRSFSVDAALMVVPEDAPDIESIPMFDDCMFFAAPAGSKFAGMPTIDLAICRHERFVALSEGFATYDGFSAALSAAGLDPSAAMQVGDIYTLINLVSGGVGFTLLPGRVRDVLKGSVQLIPLSPSIAPQQTIGLSFVRARERDPNLLTLASVCRVLLRQAT